MEQFPPYQSPGLGDEGGPVFLQRPGHAPDSPFPRHRTPQFVPQPAPHFPPHLTPQFPQQERGPLVYPPAGGFNGHSGANGNGGFANYPGGPAPMASPGGNDMGSPPRGILDGDIHISPIPHQLPAAGSNIGSPRDSASGSRPYGGPVRSPQAKVASQGSAVAPGTPRSVLRQSNRGPEQPTPLVSGLQSPRDTARYIGTSPGVVGTQSAAGSLPGGSARGSQRASPVAAPETIRTGPASPARSTAVMSPGRQSHTGELHMSSAPLSRHSHAGTPGNYPTVPATAAALNMPPAFPDSNAARTSPRSRFRDRDGGDPSAHGGYVHQDDGGGSTGRSQRTQAATEYEAMMGNDSFREGMSGREDDYGRYGKKSKRQKPKKKKPETWKYISEKRCWCFEVRKDWH